MTLVERLAAKRIPVAEYGNPPMGWSPEDDMVCALEETRWWLNAIAEELEASGMVEDKFVADGLRREALGMSERTPYELRPPRAHARDPILNLRDDMNAVMKRIRALEKRLAAIENRPPQPDSGSTHSEREP